MPALFENHGDKVKLPISNQLPGKLASFVTVILYNGLFKFLIDLLPLSYLLLSENCLQDLSDHLALVSAQMQSVKYCP